MGDKCTEEYIGENGKKYKVEIIQYSNTNNITCKITFKKFFIFKYEKIITLNFNKRIDISFRYPEVFDYVHRNIIDTIFFHRELTKEILPYKY